MRRDLGSRGRNKGLTIREVHDGHLVVACCDVVYKVHNPLAKETRKS